MSNTAEPARAGTETPVTDHDAEQFQHIWNRVVGRRSFLQRAGLAGALALPGAAAVASSASAATRGRLTSEPTRGDFAILRFLCAAEIIESDLWDQYAGFGGQATTERPHDGQNNFYVTALQNLDSDMPQYISDNTDDEESHQAFINAYLMSKGQEPVSLERFRRILPSPATGGGSKKRITNLKALNVDTSYYLRYRAETNPDFGAMFGQAVTIKNQPVIPVSDMETPPGTTAATPPIPSDPAQQRMQAIANSAGFHFGMIEQGGSSLYTTMALRVTSVEVLRIVVAIGGVETNHFSLWHDKAGNAVADPLAGVTDPKTGTTFPNLNTGSEATQPNLILPEPCEFIPGLPACSVVRPTLDAVAGARAAVAGLTKDGLFDGQSAGFFDFIKRLAREADAAERGGE
ncbi:MAG: ferritin-like domain-containing protein [Solirubrobacterales bacterium]|nr:ferritin-like domain-containing protein [Solirubrobacterales bacterium]